ncbi:MAG: AmmeMemoRadiSam system protein B [Chloroflexi bacterium]|nr:AmmeMemoRadiSam system protein B [Chloroflexota bacterium]
MSAAVRPAAVVGQLYERSPSALRLQMEECIRGPLGPGRVPQPSEALLTGLLGLVLPHAGYAYSGPVAATGIAALAGLGRPEVVAILGPNHYGLGAGLALSSAAFWETPLGRSPVDTDLGEALRRRLPRLVPDAAAHRMEHSIEAVLPWLQHLYGTGLPFLPVCLSDQSLETCRKLGAALAEVLRDRRGVVIASSDLSHYFPRDRAEVLDKAAIEAVLSLDPAAVARAAEEVNMCGPGAVMAMLETMRRLGKPRARLLGYATSADTGGDPEGVVGYCSVLVTVEGHHAVPQEIEK